MRAANLVSDDWDEQRERPGYTWARQWLRGALGGELLGASLYELPPATTVLLCWIVPRKTHARGQAMRVVTVWAW